MGMIALLQIQKDAFGRFPKGVFVLRRRATNGYEK
jgi:hypothetical protein